MKLLIVEDEIGIANFLKEGLEEEGYEVLIANDGKKGYEISQSQKIDLILLDWILPKMTGIEVCKSIRKTDTKVPIIFLTAKDTVQETIEGLKSGANDYMKKPFSFDELVERIRIHFRASKDSEVLTLGPIKVITSKYQVFLNDAEVVFTQREFDAFSYLNKTKGSFCTRNQIIDVGWDCHFDYETGSINVFMNSNRN